MEKKYKYIIAIFIIFLVLIAILFFVYFNFFYKSSFYRYSDDDFKFNYDTNFRVNKKDNKYSILNKDDSAKITIEVVENSTGVEDKNRALEIAGGKVNDNYQRTSFNCLDHICMSVFESDKKHVVVDVEFIDNQIYVYMLTCSKNDIDKYNAPFDLVVNSFMRND